jgi:hypothetical protein
MPPCALVAPHATGLPSYAGSRCILRARRGGIFWPLGARLQLGPGRKQGHLQPESAAWLLGWGRKHAPSNQTPEPGLVLYRTPRACLRPRPELARLARPAQVRNDLAQTVQGALFACLDQFSPT